jgi:Protein of unknown function (DUF1778)
LWVSCVDLIASHSDSIVIVSEKDDYIPSRRFGKGSLRKQLLGYCTQEELDLVLKAAKAEGRSRSSFVALAAIERAKKILGRS